MSDEVREDIRLLEAKKASLKWLLTLIKRELQHNISCIYVVGRHLEARPETFKFLF